MTPYSLNQVQLIVIRTSAITSTGFHPSSRGFPIVWAIYFIHHWVDNVVPRYITLNINYVPNLKNSFFNLGLFEM